jgi:hypothetical protein
MRDISGPLERS